MRLAVPLPGGDTAVTADEITHRFGDITPARLRGWLRDRQLEPIRDPHGRPVRIHRQNVYSLRAVQHLDARLARQGLGRPRARAA